MRRVLLQGATAVTVKDSVELEGACVLSGCRSSDSATVGFVIHTYIY